MGPKPFKNSLFQIEARNSLNRKAKRNTSRAGLTPNREHAFSGIKQDSGRAAGKRINQRFAIAASELGQAGRNNDEIEIHGLKSPS